MPSVKRLLAEKGCKPDIELVLKRPLPIFFDLTSSGGQGGIDSA